MPAEPMRDLVVHATLDDAFDGIIRVLGDALRFGTALQTLTLAAEPDGTATASMTSPFPRASTATSGGALRASSRRARRRDRGGKGRVAVVPAFGIAGDSGGAWQTCARVRLTCALQGRIQTPHDSSQCAMRPWPIRPPDAKFRDNRLQSRMTGRARPLHQTAA